LAYHSQRSIVSCPRGARPRHQPRTPTARKLTWPGNQPSFRRRTELIPFHSTRTELIPFYLAECRPLEKFERSLYEEIDSKNLFAMTCVIAGKDVSLHKADTSSLWLIRCYRIVKDQDENTANGETFHPAGGSRRRFV